MSFFLLPLRLQTDALVWSLVPTLSCVVFDASIRSFVWWIKTMINVSISAPRSLHYRLGKIQIDLVLFPILSQPHKV